MTDAVRRACAFTTPSAGSVEVNVDLAVVARIAHDAFGQLAGAAGAIGERGEHVGGDLRADARLRLAQKGAEGLRRDRKGSEGIRRDKKGSGRN